MKNIKNILGMGAFMLLTSLAVSSCTEKSDWDIDSSYSRPFGTDENGISVETDSKVARAVVTWSSTSNTDYYIIEISPNEMTDETPMGSEEMEISFMEMILPTGSSSHLTQWIIWRKYDLLYAYQVYFRREGISLGKL